MPAGDSAGAEARRQLALADAHAQAAAEARATAARYGVAEVTEKRTALALAPLTAVGHHLLADRRWPGSRRAQVDLVVVGPGGVFIVDTKAWKDVSIHGGRIHRGDEDVTDDVMALADLGYTAEGDLAEVGLAPGEVRAVVVLAGRQGINESVGPVRVVGEKDVLRHVASFGNRLTPSQVDVVLGRALTLFPQVNAPAPVNVVVPEPVVAPPPEPVQEALLSDDEVQAALLEGILASPIEEWMSFLHPYQAKLVRRSFNGPARIRGSAGTGKTVVGLHRAAYLARTRPGRVLVTTFVRTLPAVMRQMLGRMAPDVVEKVHFTGVHGFALTLLKERGVGVNLKPALADEAFAAAWDAVGRHGLLAAATHGPGYWREEIDYVLKGRGVQDVTAYADVARTGRRHRLTVEQRRAVWDLHRAYDDELRRRRVHDYADVILLAEAELRREPLTGYSSVIVDEAQDLSCAMVRMLYGLVGDAADGFTLIGDGQQSIYPGGYTLAEVGISLAGRGVVMDVNYRNTAQILAFASRMVADDEFADIEGVLARGDTPANVPRTGPEPVIDHCRSWRERDARLVARARAVVREVGTRPGDVGVLCMSRRAAQRAAEALRADGAPVVMLEDYDGSQTDAVKIGTIKRAKGLEFKQVLLPDVRATQIGDATPPADDTERERWERLRRELYVAMTRARDGLWVGVV
ncbi:nuclease-related domain-containing DEAD/DEAH box helicase [Cellulomonas carbonis]|uniref:DNA 3'-5' helicase n=1 Tax=Cellulomonas carbonis T26 TaxID=947969 RepID=A0A0A0BR55_9CELL|nr:UvrD-helicase domain-containing protein [Cellulomonas carbonis]KGM10953.1 NERD nuclease [Cellulomonas carbonis T26]GGC02353.1 DNA helicase [Cellulomonas carbonis]